MKENKKSKEAKLKGKEPKNNIKKDKNKTLENKVQKDKSKITDNKAKKEKKPNKFIEIIKKKWLINGTKTLILVLLIVAIFLGINIGMQKLNLTPIDFSQEKLYTLSDESKDKVKNIDKEIHIYFIGYSEEAVDLDLAKQYNKANEKIIVESVNATDRPDLVEKYGITTDTSGIIVACGEKSKVLSANDLVTYDSSTGERISIAEEKLTSAIMTVTADEIPKVYFLEGYGQFSLNQNMKYLQMYLQNEITETTTLNVLSTGKIPDDCDTLVITTPEKDFDDVATNSIIDYINKGGNILWLNAALSTSKDLPNVNKVLALYGIEPFTVGVIRETDNSKMLSGAPDFIIPEAQYSEITEDLYENGIIFVNATKINVNDEKLSELKVTKNDILKTSESAYFRTDFSIQSNEAQENEEKGQLLLGAELEKTISEGNEETGEGAKTSKLIIYGENFFVSDYQLSQNSQYPIIQLAYNNKDVVLNSIAKLSDREEDITARKSTGTVTYTATEQQDIIVKAIIFVVPISIIIAGIIVWQVRRRKK